MLVGLKRSARDGHGVSPATGVPLPSHIRSRDSIIEGAGYRQLSVRLDAIGTVRLLPHRLLGATWDELVGRCDDLGHGFGMHLDDIADAEHIQGNIAARRRNQFRQEFLIVLAAFGMQLCNAVDLSTLLRKDIQDGNTNTGIPLDVFPASGRGNVGD